jgi:hypothetical protein
MNENLKNQKSEEEIINEALFGADEDIDMETAGEILASYNIDCDDLVIDLKSNIQQELKENYGRKDKEEESENLGKVLRDISNYQRANDPKQIEPKNLIQGFLDGTIQSKLKPSYDFRNKSKDGISQNDKQILEELDSELDKE